MFNSSFLFINNPKREHVDRTWTEPGLSRTRTCSLVLSTGLVQTWRHRAWSWISTLTPESLVQIVPVQTQSQSCSPCWELWDAWLRPSSVLRPLSSVLCPLSSVLFPASFIYIHTVCLILSCCFLCLVLSFGSCFLSYCLSPILSFYLPSHC